VFVGLAWDEPRRTLVERIRGVGAGCTVLLVVDDEAVATAGDGVTRVPASAITAGARLSL